MSKRSFFTALGAGTFSLFALVLAHANEMPAHKHTAKIATTRHVSARTPQNSYARMPTGNDMAPVPSMSSPNLFETGHPPAQPGPAH